jgi:hypothetical protein
MMIRRITSIIILQISLSNTFAQNVSDSCVFRSPIPTPEEICKIEFDTTLNFDVVYFPEIEAIFPGGFHKMRDFITKNIKYIDPNKYIELSGKNNATIVSFIIEKDGKLSHVHIKQSVTQEMDDVVLALVYKMPDWEPARCNEKNVPSLYYLPIKFW